MNLATNSNEQSCKIINESTNVLLTLYVLLFYFLFSVPSLQAKQIKFSKHEQGDSYQFSYLWLDNSNNEQQISFALSKETLFDRFRNFRVYNSEIAQNYIRRKLQRTLRSKPIPNVIVSFHQKNMNAEIEIKAKNEQSIYQARQHIAQLEAEFYQEYLQKNYYTSFLSVDAVNAIKPDHVTFANIASKDLKVIKPLILKQFSIQNIRKVTEYVLNFVQNIPYSTLESRVHSSGAGFNPPTKLLWENQGDCDSKVTLTAAILRSLMPRIKMALVFIDNHAMIGINIPVEGDELFINLDGVNYVLAEPTGPALLPLGELGEESKLAILAGRYSAEKFHALPE